MNRAVKTGAVLLVCAPLTLAGCAAGKGGAIGAGSGGLVGGLIGNRMGNTAAGVIAGAAIGGTAGALIGHRMDKQAKELEKDLEGAKVERVGEGVLITFDSGILFESESDELESSAKANVKELSRVLRRYDDTNVMIIGHTDARGADDYNRDLSESRAETVAETLVMSGIKPGRIQELGRGETEPVADNESAQGRAANRRVEVVVVASEELKKAAKKGSLEASAQR